MGRARGAAVRFGAAVALLTGAWLATPTGAGAADDATISGVVSSAAGSEAIEVGDVTLQLLTPAGDPVPDARGNSLTAVTGADGKYAFSEVPHGQFEVAVEIRPGMDSNPASIPVDTTSGAADGVDFEVAMVIAPDPPVDDDANAGLWLGGGIGLLALVAIVLAGLSLRRRART